MRIVLAYPTSRERVDGIRDYATRLLAQLRADGQDARLDLVPRGLGCTARLLADLPRGRPAALVVQYNPFSWGRWGVAPGLLLAVAAVRLRRPTVRVLLMVHESYVPMRDASWVLMGAWQRAQLCLVLLGVDRVLVATTAMAAELSRVRPRRPVDLLPVGSNLPDARADRSAARAEAGYDGRLVVASFQTGHESHLRSFVDRAAQALAAASRQPVVLLLLGSSDAPAPALAGVERVVAPGFQQEGSLARSLATADLFLAPFTDGASTRRTTLMAALQHGLPVVTTVAERTDVIFRDREAFGLAAADDPEAFAAEAVRIGLDPALRERHGAAARALYERWFDWSVVGTRLLEAVERSG